MNDNVNDANEQPGWSGAQKCGHPTKAGGVCPRPVMPGLDVCYTHSLAPDKRRPGAAQSVGNHAALARKITAATSPAELAKALSQVAGLVLTGAIPVKTAAVIGQLGKAALEALKQDRSNRLDEIEAHLSKNPQLGVPKRRR